MVAILKLSLMELEVAKYMHFRCKIISTLGFCMVDEINVEYLVTSFSFNLTDHKNELVRALEEVLSDDSFKINAAPTTESRKSSERLLEWCCKEENSHGNTLNEFTQKLVASLKQIIASSRTKKFSCNTEKFWRNFFLLRITPEFINMWKTFLEGSGVKPLLFQHLSDLIFRKYLSDHFRVVCLDQQADSEDLELQDSERGVLRYVAG